MKRKSAIKNKKKHTNKRITHSLTRKKIKERSLRRASIPIQSQSEARILPSTDKEKNSNRRPAAERIQLIKFYAKKEQSKFQIKIEKKMGRKSERDKKNRRPKRSR